MKAKTLLRVGEKSNYRLLQLDRSPVVVDELCVTTTWTALVAFRHTKVLSTGRTPLEAVSRSIKRLKNKYS